MDWAYLPKVVMADQRKFDQVLTVTDRASKQVILIPCNAEQTATQLAEVFLHEVVRHRGLPSSIISDRDNRFRSEFWESLCLVMGIKRRMSSPFHPQTNGQAERTNKTMKQVLRTMVLAKLSQNPQQTVNWVQLLDFVEIAVNNAPIGGTEFSPYYVNLGYHPTFFLDVPEDL